MLLGGAGTTGIAEESAILNSFDQLPMDQLDLLTLHLFEVGQMLPDHAARVPNPSIPITITTFGI